MRIKVLLFGSPGLGSFNLCGAAGVEAARRGAQNIELIWIESAGPAIRAARLIDICHKGADLIIAYGPYGDYPVTMAAARFPHIGFVVVQGSQLSSNTAVYGVRHEQTAFLAGVLAAAESCTGGVGHLSGVKSSAALAARAAYADGVQRQEAGTGLLTSFCGSREDAELAFDTCEAMGKRGVDIIFADVDGARPGVTRACQKFHMRQIGTVLDWTETDPDIFLGSAIVNAGLCIVAAIQDFAHGALAFGRERMFGVEAPEYARLALAGTVSAGTRAAVDEWTHALAEGRIKLARDYAGKEFEQSGLLSRL